MSNPLIPRMEDFPAFHKHFQDYGYEAHFEVREGSGDKLILVYQEQDRPRSSDGRSFQPIDELLKHLATPAEAAAYLERRWQQLEPELTNHMPSRLRSVINQDISPTASPQYGINRGASSAPAAN